MITEEKLETFRKYSGNIESWDRFGKPKDKQILTYKEWTLIDELIQNIKLIEKKLASESFELLTYEKLKASCDSIKTQHELIELANIQ